LTKNIRERRGANVKILAPLFMDKDTDPEIGHAVPTEKLVRRKSIHDDSHICNSPTQIKVLKNKENAPTIHLDAMAFGMGSCCIQCTFSTKNLDSARNLYDQLVPCCPALLALTASTPILRGLLAETDVRWYVIAGSVDDRTVEESFVIKKSRYDSVSLYISNNEKAKKNSDINHKISEKEYKKLKESGLDDQLASHFAHLFIRDPLVVFDNSKEVDDKNSSEHFENIQSTNWQTCRFKPPPPNSNIGWRVEFRVMEVQLSDFENAALAVFTSLLTRIIITYDLDLYMPISKVDENMARAHKRDAVLNQKFYFKKILSSDNDEIVEMSVNEMMNGSKDFVGIIPLMRNFLDSLMIDLKDRLMFERYLQYMSDKASGKLQTTAAYLRNFVLNHPKYKHDSVVSEEINYDLLKLCRDIGSGNLKPKELF
jgi:glutamate--cysteine ligase catalytic subunit